ncbi:MAG: hypothetical protein ABFE13_07260 [Phycisphaerales bacterium]
MDRRSCILTMVTVACVGLSARAQAVDPNTYTIPAREQLFLGTLSGLTEAYQILDGGIGDPNVSGDKREMILLHVIARAGLLVFDRNDVSVNTSVLEVAEPFGISVTGDALFPDDPCDPDRVEIHWPIDPNDPNCVRFPPDADVQAAAVAINTAILPELDSILSELNQVTNSPVFAMILTAAETGDVNDTEIDYGDVLVLRAGLLGAKTLIHSVASPGYNLAIDPNDPLFAGWQCEDLTPSTTIAEVLDAYPNLLEILSGTGAANLAQAKTNLIAALTAVNAALDFIEAETDEQENDLLYIETEEPDYQTIRTEVNRFLTSLQSGTAQTYTVESRQKYAISLGAESIGEMGLLCGFLGSDEFGYIHLSDANELPEWWAIEYFDIAGGAIEGDAEGTSWDGYPYWAWFTGTISDDGSQIENLSLSYWNWWSSDTINGLSAQRTDNDPTNVQFNPNPLFAGTVSLRDILPQFDANTPVAETMGHGLDDDPTLGGVTPGLTQQDWLGTGYEVYGVSDPNILNGMVASESMVFDLYHHLDRWPDLLTKLGSSSGETKTFADPDRCPWYVVAVRSRTLIDSVYGPGNSYLDPNDDEHAQIFNIPVFEDSLDGVEFIPAGPVLGAPDGNRVAVGDLGLFGQFTGFVCIENPGNWTSLTVVTDGPCLLHDWNGDGIISIVGDVPPFVQCVYFNDCPDDMDTLCVGDCNGDGILSIVGDVPCFVECVYFNDCP